MDSRAIGIELVSGTSRPLVRRRRIAAIAAALAADFALIGMRQYGAIRRLPDLPVRGFDSNAVTTSPSAYPFGIPDSALAIAGLGGIVALATAGGSRLTGRGRWLDLALGAAVALGAAGAVYYLDDMIRRQRRLCAYCLVAAAGFLAMVPLAIPDVLRQAKAMRRSPVPMQPIVSTCQPRASSTQPSRSGPGYASP